MMNTLIDIADVIKKTKRAQMFWEEGYNCNFYSAYRGNQYQLVLNQFLIPTMVVFSNKFDYEDYYIMADPGRDGLIARLYFIVNMLNNLKSN